MINNELSSCDLLTISRLRCSCHIGCSEKERSLPQVIYVTVTLLLKPYGSAKDNYLKNLTPRFKHTDNLHDTVDYSELSKGIIDRCAKSKCNLIETLADDLADYCLFEFEHNRCDVPPKAPIVYIKIEKPAGIPNADGAVLEIRRGWHPAVM